MKIPFPVFDLPIAGLHTGRNASLTSPSFGKNGTFASLATILATPPLTPGDQTLICEGRPGKKPVSVSSDVLNATYGSLLLP